MSFTQEQRPSCPACQSVHTVRQVSMPSIHFKGSGFYQTDARADEDKKEKAADTDSNTDTGENKDQKSTEAASENGETKSAKEDKSPSKTSSASRKKRPEAA